MRWIGLFFLFFFSKNVASRWRRLLSKCKTSRKFHRSSRDFDDVGLVHILFGYIWIGGSGLCGTLHPRFDMIAALLDYYLYVSSKLDSR